MMAGKKNSRYLQALYSTIIFIIPSAFIGGYFLGMKLDEQFGTEPWITIAGVFLGGTGAFIELFRVLNRGERSSRRNSSAEKTGQADSRDSKKNPAVPDPGRYDK
jgi:F0F1-type ATP synthase assembly protein I